MFSLGSRSSRVRILRAAALLLIVLTMLILMALISFAFLLPTTVMAYAFS